MALNSYSTIKDAVVEWLNREGFNDVDDRVEDFIIMGQRRINRTVRIPPMEVKLELTIDSNGEADIPTDFMDAKYMVATEGTESVEVSRGTYTQVKRLQTNGDGCPSMYDLEAGKILFGTTPGSGVTMTMIYYQELEFVTSSTAENWFSQYAPELILYAALIEASIYLRSFESRREYEGEYKKAIARLEKQQSLSEYSGSPLQVRQT